MSARPKVLITVPLLHGRAEPYAKRLEAEGFAVATNPQGRALREDELIALLPGVVATIAGSEPYNERVFQAAPELKVVARLGVGYDAIDLAAATRHRVPIAMAFGTNHEAVADFAFGLMAGLALRLLAYHQRVTGGGWGTSLHCGLFGKTVGIVGFGRIGQSLARRCRGFAMRVLAADPLVTPELAETAGARLVAFDELLREADFVSLHAPMSAATEGLIGREALALMKPTAFLVNTARGGLIDEDALLLALRERRIAGAGLDVFRKEPPAGSPLLALPNVLLAPHCAGTSAEATAAMAERAVESVLAILAGREPGAGLVLNPEVLSP